MEAVLQEAKKVAINTTFKTRKFTFSDNEVGDVADKLTIELDFSKVDLQPDADFEARLKEVCLDFIASHIEGLWENQ